ncbi:MAG: hypothetical protein M0P70_04700 [Desulfobulbaceae bacterium]|nr:hypothetical protein [Desulfobulbaceae bacterium]
MKRDKTSQEEKLQLLFDCLRSLQQGKFTGSIRVNMNQGNICKVEKYEEILRDTARRGFTGNEQSGNVKLTVT